MSMLVIAVLMAPAIPGARAFGAEYTVTNLGSFAGNVSEAFGLNDLGQVVGYSNTSTNSTFPHPHAFLYSKGTLTDLGTFGAGQFLSGDQSHAYGINNAGQIVGDSVVSVNNGTFLPSHAFLYAAGTMTDLGTLDSTLGAASQAYAINGTGQIAGDSLTSNGLFHSFIYANGTMTNLGAGFPTRTTNGFAINSNGVVAGTEVLTSPTGDPALFQNGTIQDLGGTGGSAKGTNDLGQIVGQSAGDAFLDSGGVMTDLGRLANGTGSIAYDINNGGVIVGSGMHTSFADTAFIYRNGVITNLNSLIDPTSGWSLTEARAINDEGQIVGTGFFFGVERAYLLTPVPEPASLAILGMAATFFLTRRRRLPI
jgi:probable HAF family extracellular repeat protein